MEPKGIKVWVDDTITWKEGVKLKAANENGTALRTLLAEANVTDESGRNSDAANLPNGTPGTLKLTFNDNSTLTVENQMLYVSPVKAMKDDTTDPNKLSDKKVQVDIKLGEGIQITVGSDTKKGDATNPYAWGTFFLKSGTGLEVGDFPVAEAQPGYKANSAKWDPADQIKVWNENNPKPDDAIQVSFAKGTGVTALNPEGKTMTVKPNTTLAVSDFPTATVDTAKGYAGQALWTGKVPNLGHKVTAENNVFTATAQRPFDDANITDIAFAKDPDKMSYNEGEPLQLAGLEIKLTDKYGTTKMIGVNELDKYKITIETKDGINDHNGKNLTAKGKVKIPTGGEEDKTVTSPGTLDVHKKRSGGFFFFPAAEEEKHETAIHKAYIFGYEDDSFKPEGNMTRAEAAAMLARLQGLDLSNDARPDFMDVRSGWYNGSINAVVNAGYMKGYPDNTFRPNGKITRAEFAQMIKAIDKENTGVAPFADVKGHWAEAAINQAFSNGRIAGYPDGTFRPNNNITRAEAVTVFNKLYDRSVDEAGLANVQKGLVDFTDIKRGHWAYDQVVEASNTHEYYRTKKGEVAETWVKIIQTWKDILAHR